MPSGRTSRAHLVQESPKEVILGLSSKRSQKPKFQYLSLENGQMPEWSEAMELVSLGEYLTLNITESPSVGVESFLSQALEPDAPEKYFLSKKACEGILRRAAKRGKELPPLLKEALEAGTVKDIETIAFTTNQRSEVRDLGSASGALTAQKQQTLIVLNDQGGASMSVEKSDLSPTLRSQTHGNLPIVGVHQNASGTVRVSDNSYALTTNSSASSRNAPLVAHVHRNTKVFGICSYRSNSMLSKSLYAGIYEADTVRTLDTSCGNPAVQQGGMAVVCVSFTSSGYGGLKEGVGTLRSQGGDNGGGSENLVVSDRNSQYIIRRLTPTECERLQGFPDGWTKYGHDDKVLYDTRRYTMLGNSLAIPCVKFVLSGIAFQLRKAVMPDYKS